MRAERRASLKYKFAWLEVKPIDCQFAIRARSLSRPRLDFPSFLNDQNEDDDEDDF